MTAVTTTLAAIRQFDPCVDGWQKLLEYLDKTKADDEPLPLSTVLDSNGLADALWCLRTRPDLDRLWRLYAVWCAAGEAQAVTVLREPAVAQALPP